MEHQLKTLIINAQTYPNEEFVLDKTDVKLFNEEELAKYEDFGYPFKPIGRHWASNIAVWPLEEFLARNEKFTEEHKEFLIKYNTHGFVEGVGPVGWKNIYQHYQD